MNASALRQVSAHWDEVIDAAARMRQIYGEWRGGYRPELWELWRVSQLSSALPWHFILRGITCPAYSAALAKIMLGVGIWAQKMFVDALVARTPVPPLTQRMIFETSDANGTLIAEHEVCAAGEKMMLPFYDAVITDQLPRGIVEFDATAVARFGAHYTAYKQLLWMYWLARRGLYGDLAAARGMTHELATLLEPEAEPHDFFLLPVEFGGLPLVARQAWFTTLAAFVLPIIPDGSDQPYRALALRLAEIVGTAVADDPIAQLVGQFDLLDSWFGEVTAVVERGLGGPDIVFDAKMRDRLLRDPPRQLFASLRG